MADNYTKLVRNNLEEIYKKRNTEELLQCLPGKQEGESILFPAFGEICRISPRGIFLGEEKQESVIGILLSLYALHTGAEDPILMPLKAFKDFPGSAPYAGAFVSHTQNVLISHVPEIEKNMDTILEKFKGYENTDNAGGDAAFTLWPLPKIALTYIFYEADEDFPASVTCLYSNNASLFMPMDGLADVGEYTSAEIIRLLKI
ncbi:MAG: DUF3786 domain-containing protein [Desulfococcaceae bacterium]|jgi:hypothetical protein|nr:DUF3786 domain-containing protein [Desulfococcaceae bacterium]